MGAGKLVYPLLGYLYGLEPQRTEFASGMGYFNPAGSAVWVLAKGYRVWPVLRTLKLRVFGVQSSLPI